MGNQKMDEEKIHKPHGAELFELTKALGKNRNSGIDELKKMEKAVRSINLSKAAMSADKRAGFVFEEVVAGTYNAAARKAGDFNTTAITGTSGGFGIDPKVDIQVVQNGKVIAEAQAKCCGNTVRTAVSVAKPKYEDTQRIVPAGQGKPVQKMLADSAKAKAKSANPRMREIGAARQEASGKVTEQLKAGGHKSQQVSHEEAIKMAKGDTSKLSQMVAVETMMSAAVNGAKAGAAFSGGISAITSFCDVVNGKVSAKNAVKTVATETVVGGVRSAATSLVAEGVKSAAKNTLSKATAGALIRGAGPMAVAGCVVDVVTDACKGELTAKNAAKSATRAAGGWVGAECGAMLGTAIFPGVGTVIGGLLGGVCGSMLGGAW